MNIKNKRILAKTIEDIRGKVIVSLGLVEKDKILANKMLETEAISIYKKSEELQEEFY